MANPRHPDTRHPSKEEAEQRAERLRKLGYKVKVTESNAGRWNWRVEVQ